MRLREENNNISKGLVWLVNLLRVNEDDNAALMSNHNKTTLVHQHPVYFHN